MKYIYTFILLLILPPAIFGQGEGNMWTFGEGAGIDFNSGSPVSFSSSTTGSEGSATVSDADGNLLFYSNGKSAWNRTHTMMPGASSLIPTYPSSTTQACAIVPLPGSDSLFYIFSLEDIGITEGGLYYSIVDMSLDGGMGDVISSETGVFITDDLCEKMTVVEGTCENAWVIVHSRSVNEYYAYEITEDGISAPVVSTIGTGDYEAGYEVGVIKVSPDRTKMAAALYGYPMGGENGAEIYDFDITTGIVSNRQILIDGSSEFYEGYYYGASFSPDNSKIYFSSGTQLVQFDLSLSTLAAIIASGTYIAPVGFGDMKIAPDEKIYVCRTFGSDIAAINSPNLAGTACAYVATAFSLSSGSISFGFPNTTVVPKSQVDSNSIIIHDTVICSSLTISGREGATEYEWSTGATDESITITEPGTYWVISKNGCSVIDTFYVSLGVVDEPLISVSDATICPEEDRLQVHAEAKASGTLSYLWGPAAAVVSGISDANAVINTDLTDKAFVTVTNQKDLCSASAKDTIHISRFPPADFRLLNNDTLVCQGEIVNLNVQGPGKYHYEWAPDSRVADPYARLTSVYTGLTDRYSITVKDEHGCITTDSFLLATRHCCTILIPDAFSPNGDGINDVFSLKGETSQRVNEFSIFNRLGQRIYTSVNQDDIWDGTFSGKKCDMGVYFYYLRYTCSDENEYVKRGNITLLR